MNVSIENELVKARSLLRENGAVNPGLEVNRLLEVSAGRSLERIFSSPEILANENVKKKFFTLLKRRVSGEPLDYVCGKSSFYSKEFCVDRGVFIPRSDTEVLVDAVLSEAEKYDLYDLIVLDMCCGTGCVGLSLAHFHNFKKIYLADKTPDSISCAKKNQNLHGLEKKTEIFESDLFSSVPSVAFKYIVSNPPYVSAKEFAHLDKSIKNYEPIEALLSSNEGLWHLAKIASEGRRFLPKDGGIFLEIGACQGLAAKKILFNLGYSEVELLPDLNKIDRVVKAKWKN